MFLLLFVALFCSTSFAHVNVHSQAKKLTLIEHAFSDTTVFAAGANGRDALGNLLVFNNTMFDSTDSHQVGTNQGSCVRSAVGWSWNCGLSVTYGAGDAAIFFYLNGPLFDANPSSTIVFTATQPGGESTFVGHGSITALPNKRFRFDLIWQ